MKSGIYKITNPKGKIYIGQSINIYKRFKQYKNPSKSQSRLYYSIKKYGYENHIFEIIEYCETLSLNTKERFWQDYYNVINNGLNCTATKTSNKSGKLSDKTITKISQNRKGIKSNFKDPIVRAQKISIALKGKKLSSEHREKLSKAQTGLKRSKEAILKSINSRKGLKMPETAKKIISQKQKENNSFAKIMLNTQTGIYYVTAKEAAESIGMTYNSFNHYINGRTKRKLPFIFA
jgi:group I intron endonuclease